MNDETAASVRFDVYRAVTDKIVAAIEAGAGEFHMPWHGVGAAIAKPQNALTKMEYHGLNVIALWAQAYSQGYQSGYWASYKQWQSVGAQVCKGEHGSTIVFFRKFETKDEQDEPSERLIARATRVFNADQVIGWTPPAPYAYFDDVERLETVETFVQATKADIHYGGQRACYHIRDDYIEMPSPSRFIGSDTSTPEQALCACLLHELIHWSGADHRLKRGLGSLTKEKLADEELVAEIGAAFLCADLEVANEPRPDHAAYVASWLKLLKDDKRAIFRASRLASQAANFLHELVAFNEWRV